MSSKYANLTPVGGSPPPWVTPDVARRAKTLAARIGRRTGDRAWFDTVHKEICFGNTEADGRERVRFSCRLYRDYERNVPCLFDPLLDIWHEDSIVRMLNLASVDPKLKDHWARHYENMRKSDEANRKGELANEHARRAFEATERQYETHTMGRHYRGRAAVNGIKGGV